MNNLGTFSWITAALILSSKLFSRAAFKRSVGYQQPDRPNFLKRWEEMNFPLSHTSLQQEIPLNTIKTI